MFLFLQCLILNIVIMKRVDFKISPKGRVYVDGKCLNKYELGVFIHKFSILVWHEYYKHYCYHIYCNEFSYADLKRVFVSVICNYNVLCLNDFK